jgi:ribonuclease HI
MREIIVHSDGGCSGNPGPGAWAYVMRYGERLKEDSGFAPETTNNKMELKAVIEALSFLGGRRREAKPDSVWLSSPIRVLTDSQYVKNGVTLWLAGWKAKGWKTADKKPVKNQELWQELDALVSELKPSFAWVEGHAGVPDNERCDALVRAKIAECKKL